MYVCMFVCVLFPHSAKTNGPIFKIQTPIIRVYCRIGSSDFLFLNLLPVSPGKFKMNSGFDGKRLFANILRTN